MKLVTELRKLQKVTIFNNHRWIPERSELNTSHCSKEIFTFDTVVENDEPFMFDSKKLNKHVKKHKLNKMFRKGFYENKKCHVYVKKVEDSTDLTNKLIFSFYMDYYGCLPSLTETKEYLEKTQEFAIIARNPKVLTRNSFCIYDASVLLTKFSQDQIKNNLLNKEIFYLIRNVDEI